jgi:hypothetical protein
VKEVDAGLGKEGRRKLYLRCRSVGCINWGENSAVRRLIRTADYQDWLLHRLQQTLNGAGDELIRERTPSVPAGHHEIDIISLRARRNGNSRISNADINAIRQLVARHPSANLSLEVAPSVRPSRFDDGSSAASLGTIAAASSLTPWAARPSFCRRTTLATRRRMSW